MADDPAEQLEHPADTRATDHQRRDGRPSDPDAEGIRDVPHESAPTVAPEEKGGSPTTEHAPGGDL
ncbi:MAG: hypothetical protein ACJ779_04215 [Chloroflexota bacterium]